MSSSDESDSSGSSGDERENLHVATTANDDDDDDDVAHRSNSSDEDKSSDTQAAVVNNLPGSDDDDDKSSTVVALNQQTSSDDDDERQKSINQVDNAQTTARELFGEADLSLSDDDDDDEDVDKNRQMTADDIVGPRLYPDPDDEEQEVAAPPESVIEVEAPKITVDLGNDGPYFVKFPNFLSVEPRPFDPDHYEDEIDEDEQLDEEGRSRLKLKVENTIRWRYAEDETGQVVKQSNSKLVRWSDGSLSLQLGSEIFDVHLQPIQDHNHLFVRQGAGLQGQSVFRTKLTFRPHSTDTLTHRKMTLSMADRSNKTQKVKVLSAVGADPETQKQELVRREEERLRATARRESQQRRVRERMSGRHGLSAGFLEPDRDDDSDEGESLSAIKKSYRPGGREFDQRMRSRDGGDDSGSGESDAGRRLDAAKKDSDASDSDKELREKRRTKRKIVIEDDDDEK